MYEFKFTKIFSEKVMLFTETQLKGAFIIDLEKD